MEGECSYGRAAYTEEEEEIQAIDDSPGERMLVQTRAGEAEETHVNQRQSSEFVLNDPRASSEE